MIQNQTAVWIRLLLLLIGWGSCQFIAPENAMAQRRPAVPAPAGETPSQRYLPLPQSGTADRRQQVEWLKQLKGVLSPNPAGLDPSLLQGLTADDMKVLQEAMKQFGNSEAEGGIRPGNHPGPLPSVTPEQVSRALADPAMREQVKQALEQFANDRKLPESSSAPRPNGIPFPPNRPSPNRPSGVPPDRTGSDSPTSDDESPMQRIAQSLLERFSKQTDRQPEEPQELSPPGPRENATTRPTGPDSPRQTSPRGQTNAPRGESNGTSTAANSMNPGQGNDRPGRPSGNPSTPGRGPDMNRPDMNPRPMNPTSPMMPTMPAGEKVEANPGRSPSARTVPQTATSAEPKPGSMDVRSELEQRGFAETLRQLVDQARRDTEQEIAMQNQAGAAGGGGGASVNQPAGGTTPGGNQGPQGPALQSDPTGMAAATSNALSNPPQVSQPAGGLSGVSGTPPAPALQQPSQARSALNHVSESANKVLSNLLTPPESTSVTPPKIGKTITTPNGGSPSSAAGSRSVMWLILILVIAAAAWYIVPRMVTSMNESSQIEGLAAARIHPAEIRTRRDIVRAFHQFALRPLTPVADWWTHRQVEQQVATSTPSLEPAIHQLAEIYEQARYQPEDLVFTPDQIGAARRALEVCQSTSPVV